MKKEDSLKQFISRNRAVFESKVPAPAVRDRIWERLGKDQSRIQQSGEPATVIRPFHRNRGRVWYAAASVIVLLSVGIGGIRWLLKDPAGIQQENQVAALIPEQIPVIGQGTRPEPEGQVKRLSGMDQDAATEINKITGRQGHKQKDPAGLETRIADLLSEEKPASMRIEGILEMAALPELPQELMDKLFYMVNYDPNSNVRSAAVGMLIERLPAIASGDAIQEVFVQQDDPAIQLELMLAMAYHDTIRINETTVDRLFAIAEDPLALDFVKEQAYAVLMKTW